MDLEERIEGNYCLIRPKVKRPSVDSSGQRISYPTRSLHSCYPSIHPYFPGFFIVPDDAFRDAATVKTNPKSIQVVGEGRNIHRMFVENDKGPFMTCYC